MAEVTWRRSGWDLKQAKGKGSANGDQRSL
uniref:Uncharacterized protein n=1 Tax=Anguilla anguilla TaxID=7936 RepID=A0A0E9QFK5_ANGAN